MRKIGSSYQKSLGRGNRGLGPLLLGLVSALTFLSGPLMGVPTQAQSSEIHLTKGREMMSVQLTFLSPQQGRDLEWLKKILSEQGWSENSYHFAPSSIYSGQKELRSTSLELVKLANRLRAFHENLEITPYVLLNLRDAGRREILCVTAKRDLIKKDIAWSDEVVEVPHLQDPEIKACQVTGRTSPLYRDLGREQVREKFFDAAGALKISQYKELDRDREFILYLINLGFYPAIGDEEGFLVVQ